eukprot:6491042-Amphidinium_carterae.4
MPTFALVTESSVPTHKKWQVHAILTCVETMTGLCMAIPTGYITERANKIPVDTIEEVLGSRADGMTNYQRRWGVQCNSAICSFGEVLLADIKPITVNKLVIRNTEQNTKGIYLGKTTNSSEHIIATKDNGLLHSQFNKVDAGATMGQDSEGH